MSEANLPPRIRRDRHGGDNERSGAFAGREYFKGSRLHNQIALRAVDRN
jgi:hypothetical protein